MRATTKLAICLAAPVVSVLALNWYWQTTGGLHDFISGVIVTLVMLTAVAVLKETR